MKHSSAVRQQPLQSNFHFSKTQKLPRKFGHFSFFFLHQRRALRVQIIREWRGKRLDKDREWSKNGSIVGLQKSSASPTAVVRTGNETTSWLKTYFAVLFFRWPDPSQNMNDPFCSMCTTMVPPIGQKVFFLFIILQILFLQGNFTHNSEEGLFNIIYNRAKVGLSIYGYVRWIWKVGNGVRGEKRSKSEKPDKISERDCLIEKYRWWQSKVNQLRTKWLRTMLAYTRRVTRYEEERINNEPARSFPWF